MKPRPPRAAGVVEILRVYDALVAADDERHQRCGTRREDFSGGMLDAFVFHQVIGEEHFDDWPVESLRAIVLAFARHAPPRRFRTLLAAVRKDTTVAELADVVREHEQYEAARAAEGN